MFVRPTPRPPGERHGGAYLAVVEVLDDGLALLADVADADELGLAVALEEAPAQPLHHGRRRATAGDAAVLDVPEHAHGGRVFWTAAIRGAWGGRS